MDEDLYTRITELAKRRGFFWPSYEIYGGVAGFYDLGPYGFLLKKKIIEKWRWFFVKSHSEYVVEIESPLIGPSIVYKASGHVDSFTDPIVTCIKCGRKFRADHLIEEKLKINAEGLSIDEMTRLIKTHNISCPVCGGPLGEVQSFNLLFKTYIGPYEGNVGYIRPELAQGMFVAFKRIYEAMRNKMPLGIAQVGRVGRNEISPRQAMMRLREFTIMEMEYFIDPRDPNGSCPFFHRLENERLRILRYGIDNENPENYRLKEAVEEGVIMHPCLGYWMAVAKRFMESIGVPDNAMYFHEKGPEERAHYSSQTFDQMVKVSRWGWIEVSGHSYRGEYDLSRHMKYSGVDLTVFKSYPEPRLVRRKKIIVDKGYIGRTFKREAPRVLEAVSKLNPDDVEDIIKHNDKLTIDGFTIPASAIRIIEVEEKITGERYIPHVVEPSFGTDRVVYAAFEYAFREREGRTILSFPRDIAPLHAVVLPLNESDETLVERAKRLYYKLVNEGFDVIYDDSGSIGRRYARSDELGIPAAFTIDYRTLDDGTITMRDRDTWRQVRLPESKAGEALAKFIYQQARLEELGEPVEVKYDD